MIQALTAPTSAPFTVREVCAALDVSESGFYAHRRKEQLPRRKQDALIADAMKEVFKQNYGCYGSPRLVQALRQRGVRCGKTRIRRLMRQAGLCARQKRRIRPRTTQSDPHHAKRSAPALRAQLDRAVAAHECASSAFPQRYHLHPNPRGLLVFSGDGGRF